jgi:hypothetical protein
MTTSPSRVAGYSTLLSDAIARDGLVCFLCGHIHARSDTLQVDFRKPLDSGGEADSDNAIPTCKTCAKRRNRTPVGAYWRKRLVDAQREIAYIHQMAEDAEIMRTLAATVNVDRGVPLRHVTGAHESDGDAKPWENLPRRVRIYDSERLRQHELDNGSPKDVQHGDVFVQRVGVNLDILETVYDSVDGRWISADNAQTRGVVPDPWPPRDAEHWNL